MRVEIYWNIRKKVYSVRPLEGPDKGRVSLRGYDFTLKGATFAVQDKGRRRVLCEQRKNVHAFVRGQLIEDSTCTEGLTRVRYDPYETEFWETLEGVKVKTAKIVRLTTSADGKPRVYVMD